MKKVSILVPVYNEKDTLLQLLSNIEKANFCNLEKEIIFIDDKSTDGSIEILKELESKYKVFYHNINQGKGAALRTGIEQATGDIVVIQDADLEYSPDDYEELLKLLLEDKADVVYGSRFSGEKSSTFSMFSHFLGNKVLTFITNLLYGTRITDMETCYKVFKAEFIKQIKIKSNRFDFEPEITAKVAKSKTRLKEVPISYKGRESHEGKKITWKDGFQAILALIRFRFTD